MTFLQADARSLADVLADAGFDLLVQDFILNCAPPSDAAALFCEAARVLRPGGLALLSFTDNTGLRDRPILTAEEIAARWGLAWDPACGALSELPARLGDPVGITASNHRLSSEAKVIPTEAVIPMGTLEPRRPAFAREGLIGRVVAGAAAGHCTYITAPDGRFEFFVAAEETFAALEAAGLQPVLAVQGTTRDYNGLACTRHRCLVRRGGPVGPGADLAPVSMQAEAFR
jgi:SAM-dependent methyltransferase